MKKLIPALIFLLSSPSLFAQWKCFTPGTDQYFTNNYGYVRGMRIDSVTASGSELVYHPFRTVRIKGTDVFSVEIDSNGGSWLGKTATAKTDGSFLFENVWHDTVLIRSQANLGDSWVFYNDTTNDYYTASITALDTMTILGNQDSIKRITLTAYQNGVYSPTDSFDNTEIILSKSNGFVQVIDLYNFPYHIPAGSNLDTIRDNVFNRSLVDPSYYLNQNHSFTSYNFPFIGIPCKYNTIFRRIEVPQLTLEQSATGWDVGDVIHYTSCQVTNSACLQYPGASHVDTIVQKNITTSGTQYIYKGRVASITIVGNLPYYTTPMPDSGAFFYPNNEYVIEHMPEEITPSMQRSWFYYYYPNDTGYCQAGQVFHKVGTNISYGQPVFVGLGWIPVTIETFKVDLGLMRSMYDPMDPLDGWFRDFTIKYFIHNGTACGTPIDLSNTVSAPSVEYTENTIKLYPNPSYTELTIESPASGHSVSLINTLGQVVYRKAGCEQKESIDVQHFAGGIYYLKVESAGIGVLTRKVLLQH